MAKTSTIKNELPELLEAVCNHDNCPEWLQDVIWNGFNNRISDTSFSASYFRYLLEETTDAPAAAAKGAKIELVALTEEEIEANETFERFSHCRILADENELHQLFAGIVNYSKLSVQDQKKIFDFIAENSLVSKDELREIAIVSGFKEQQDISDSPECAELNILANQLSSAMKNELMPTRLFNVIADELSAVPPDWRTPENVLFNLQKMRETESNQ